MLQEKEAKELGECTFTPSLKKKTQFGPKVSQAAYGASTLPQQQSINTQYYASGSEKKEP